ncbi:tip elongation aberrant protein Tea4 [Schizosaccharomyces japonicus yFS275]|uniref:Tip elongation aberrant protein Tea4 n=1 Tax=Schizosaccharomyces japonicus (strain yFS275 / FY16936) TaxID=402676 RepID=B6JUT6_SCHJY|nr:tip elongation aberrant protein Tea4 [Schizosaccharomyces japonicus yFS275]EEB05038.2 tip elongation aberrant protein Tea4 [Schizosaccharomyces japonicus yFS275]
MTDNIANEDRRSSEDGDDRFSDASYSDDDDDSYVDEDDAIAMFEAELSSSPSIHEDVIDFNYVYAIRSFEATVEGQVNAIKGDVMVLLDDSNSYWWLVKLIKDESIGYLPAEYVETPTERLARLNKYKNTELLGPANNEFDTVVDIRKREPRSSNRHVAFSCPSINSRDSSPSWNGDDESTSKLSDGEDAYEQLVNRTVAENGILIEFSYKHSSDSDVERVAEEENTIEVEEALAEPTSVVIEEGSTNETASFTKSLENSKDETDDGKVLEKDTNISDSPDTVSSRADELLIDERLSSTSSSTRSDASDSSEEVADNVDGDAECNATRPLYESFEETDDSLLTAKEDSQLEVENDTKGDADFADAKSEDEATTNEYYSVLDTASEDESSTNGPTMHELHVMRNRLEPMPSVSLKTMQNASFSSLPLEGQIHQGISLGHSADDVTVMETVRPKAPSPSPSSRLSLRTPSPQILSRQRSHSLTRQSLNGSRLSQITDDTLEATVPQQEEVVSSPVLAEHDIPNEHDYRFSKDESTIDNYLSSRESLVSSPLSPDELERYKTPLDTEPGKRNVSDRFEFDNIAGSTLSRRSQITSEVISEKAFIAAIRPSYNVNPWPELASTPSESTKPVQMNHTSSEPFDDSLSTCASDRNASKDSLTLMASVADLAKEKSAFSNLRNFIADPTSLGELYWTVKYAGIRAVPQSVQPVEPKRLMTDLENMYSEILQNLSAELGTAVKSL